MTAVFLPVCHCLPSIALSHEALIYLIDDTATKMSDFSQLYQQGLYLSPDQQDLLLAALSSNNPAPKQQSHLHQTPSVKPIHSPDRSSSHGASAPPSGGFDSAQLSALGFAEDESPFLDFNPELDFEFPDSANLIGDLPGAATSNEYDIGEKRKSMDGKSEVDGDENGKKRRESEAKKPGRKPLTSEPTTVRTFKHRHWIPFALWQGLDD